MTASPTTPPRRPRTTVEVLRDLGRRPLPLWTEWIKLAPPIALIASFLGVVIVKAAPFVTREDLVERLSAAASAAQTRERALGLEVDALKRLADQQAHDAVERDKDHEKRLGALEKRKKGR